MRDITLADTFYATFTTRSFSTGAPATLSGSPVVSAYENDSITQITSGITLGVDHDSVTGLNLLTVVATGANGFESGKDYSLVITTGTVGGVSVVGEVVGEFSIERSAAAADLANGTDGLGAIKSDTAAILIDTGTTLDAALAVVDANVDAILVDTGTTLDAALAVVDANVDAILVDTGTTLDAALAVVDANVDAILVDTGTTIPGTITTLQADTDNIQTRLPAALVGGRMSSDMVAISGSTVAADNLEASVVTGGLITGTAATGTLSTTQCTTSLTAYADDQLIGRVIVFTSGAAQGEATDITDSAVANGLLTFSALTTAPGNGDTFVIV